jgi:peroxiredoxin
LTGQRTSENEENVTETSTGIEVRQAMPAFELPDEEGRPFKLLEQLHEEPVILVFYRGDWGPYCNGQLVSYARKYEESRSVGRGSWV